MTRQRRSVFSFTLASAAGLASGLGFLANAAPAELPLHSGWNLVSLPLQPTNTAIQSVLAPLQGNYKAVWTYTNGRWYGFNPSVPGLDDLKDMQAGKAYWVQLTDDGVLTLDGIVPVNGANALAGQTLNPGWNLLGYSSGRPEDITEAFALTAGNLDLAAMDSNPGWLWYRPGNPTGSTLTSLLPFQGVWAHVNAKSSWIGPNFKGKLQDAVTGKPISGATVSLDGIEAETVTDAEGNFTVAGISDDGSQILTAVARGYAPLAKTINPAAQSAPGPQVSVSSAAAVSLTPLPSPIVAEVLVPQNNSVWVVQP